MYYQNYEDYMRAVLGYPMESQDTYQMHYLEEAPNGRMLYQNTKELEDCYPEIYKIINPVVCEVCDRCNMPITKDVVEDMVEEIYQKIEINNEIAIHINLDNRIAEKKEVENRTNVAKPNTVRTSVANEQTRKSPEVENRQRRPNNPFLRDLIRILLLNRILGGIFPGRPPRPRPPMRPPFPGGSRPPRPQPRDYDEYLRF